MQGRYSIDSRVVLYLLREPKLLVPAVKGCCASLNYVFSLAVKDLVASHMFSRILSSFKRICPLKEINPQTTGVSYTYTEQNYLHGQRREFRIRNNTQETKENDVKTVLFSLAYLTPIKLPFCVSTGEREFL